MFLSSTIDHLKHALPVNDLSHSVGERRTLALTLGAAALLQLPSRRSASEDAFLVAPATAQEAKAGTSTGGPEPEIDLSLELEPEPEPELETQPEP